MKHQRGFFSFCHSRQKHAKLPYVEKAYLTVTKKTKGKKLDRHKSEQIDANVVFKNISTGDKVNRFSCGLIYMPCFYDLWNS